MAIFFLSEDLEKRSFHCKLWMDMGMLWRRNTLPWIPWIKPPLDQFGPVVNRLNPAGYWSKPWLWPCQIFKPWQGYKPCQGIPLNHWFSVSEFYENGFVHFRLARKLSINSNNFIGPPPVICIRNLKWKPWKKSLLLPFWFRSCIPVAVLWPLMKRLHTITANAVTCAKGLPFLQ